MPPLWANIVVSHKASPTNPGTSFSLAQTQVPTKRLSHSLPCHLFGQTQAVDTAVISVSHKASLREQLSALQKRVADAAKAAAAANK
eukprot:scaffold4512_cov14-Tisochrysis_lutea.AAC.1